ncbi:hypothetical protein AB434_3483 [Heyndrickxia coagulans]|uniref:Uncharacterized protein n=1 Tax=Heyndrickxia coagulans TaxID=1398 RepID=A0A0C5C2V5_HEYCO|nr:hypothetical protein SB48_HM08orf02840 [Heyndrickxia coagulans]AKN55888.1 hypothetical protein AB434_3483 [Heyndrickxia coagulans]KWZ84090.1 hypothetical protein HMPREF3213_01149 [Heyndrickxia coagulans]KYC61927.1 hypothetical protein B4100_3066 [Heyndrickxia coagulans]KYC91716.1 hypothetical protein B4096_2671 [Heyndrickxia coagulans]
MEMPVIAAFLSLFFLRGNIPFHKHLKHFFPARIYMKRGE